MLVAANADSYANRSSFEFHSKFYKLEVALGIWNRGSLSYEKIINGALVQARLFGKLVEIAEGQEQLKDLNSLGVRLSSSIFEGQLPKAFSFPPITSEPYVGEIPVGRPAQIAAHLSTSQNKLDKLLEKFKTENERTP